MLTLPPETIIVSKGDDPQQSNYSAFDGHTPSGPTFGDDLRQRNVRALSIGGIATEYCVKQSALDARRRGIRVSVLTNAIAGIEQQSGDIERALKEMSDAGVHFGAELQPTDVVLLAADWESRAPLRAQLLEDGIEVIATDEWPTMRGYLRPGVKPELAVVDLKDLADAQNVLDSLAILMKPERVFVLTALGTVPTSVLEAAGFRLLRRPISIEEIVAAIAVQLF